MREFGSRPTCENDPDNKPYYRVIGRFWAIAQRVAVHPDLLPRRARQTLLHETLHLAWHESPLMEVPKLAQFEEVVIAGLEHSLFDIIQRNPTLVKYLACVDE